MKIMSKLLGWLMIISVFANVVTIILGIFYFFDFFLFKIWIAELVTTLVIAGINKNDEDKTKDSLGDIMVTLIILAQDLNFDLLDCLNSAYRVIQNRKGKTINGVFVKESDLHD